VTSTSSPKISLTLGKSVLAVELFDIVANKLLATYHRERSRCSFTDEILHREYEIILRVDWGDLKDGEPVLDMDVYRTNSDGSRTQVQPRSASWHHTTLSTLQPGSASPRAYDVEFQGLRMRLVTKKTFGVGVGLSVHVVDPTATGSASEA
jgi:hypothetical protein